MDDNETIERETVKPCFRRWEEMIKLRINSSVFIIDTFTGDFCADS